MNRSIRGYRKHEHIRIDNNIIMLTLVIVLTLSVMLIGRMSMVRADASVQYEKSFQTIEIEPVDTLSAIAQEFAPSVADYQDYMNEVIEINNLKDGKIHAGCYLMVPVYTAVSSK